MACLRPDLFETIPAILDRNVNFNCKNRKGNTPLHICALNNNFRAMKLLLLAGADVSTKNKCDYTPIDIAKDCDHEEIILLLQSDDLYKKFEFEEKESESVVSFYRIIEFFASLRTVDFAIELSGKIFGIRDEIQYTKLTLVESISKIITKFRYYTEFEEEDLKILVTRWEEIDTQLFFDVEKCNTKEFEQFCEYFLAITTEIFKKIWKKIFEAIGKYSRTLDPLRRESLSCDETDIRSIVEEIDKVDFKRCFKIDTLANRKNIILSLNTISNRSIKEYDLRSFCDVSSDLQRELTNIRLRTRILFEN